MKTYSVSFILYGGLRIIPVKAKSKEEAIEIAKKENGLLPARYKDCKEVRTR